MKIVKNTMLMVCIAILFLSCASVAHYEAVDSAVAQGNFQGGLAMVNASKDTDYREIDQVLYNLDAGLLAHYSKDYTHSSEFLGTAERGIAAAFTKSVSKEVSSYLVNDTTKEYAGEDYEDIYINVFNSLNYFYGGSTEDALVEIRRFDNKLKAISTKYGTSITNAQQAALEKNSDIPYDAEAMTVHFTNSALARYLGMLFYRGEGLSDDARIDRDQIKLAFASQPGVYAFPLPTSIANELAIPAGKARLNVVSFNGLAPIKTENTTRIQLDSTTWIKIALPEIHSRPSAIARTVVEFPTGETFELEVIEDLSAVAVETFKQKASLLYFKAILRSTLKTATGAALESGSNKSDDSNTAMVLGLLSLTTKIYAEASEQADLRLSRYFPGKALVGGINLDPGTYSFTVKYYNASNTLINEVPFKDVVVRAKQLNLSEAICIK